MISAYLYALGASVFWGIGFIGSRYALESFQPMWTTHFRFLIAILFLSPLLLRFKRAHITKSLLWKSFVCGLFLMLMMFMQIKGVGLTTIAKSSFLTIIYAFITPILSFIFFKESLSKFFIVCLLVSLVGILFLCGFELSALNFGDLIIILSSVFASLQILFLSHFLKNEKHPLLFNYFQMLTVAITSFILAIILEGTEQLSRVEITSGSMAIYGVLFMGVFSTAIAFVLQVRCQRLIKAHIAGLIYLVESPIAALLAYFIFDESLTLVGFIGCLLILSSTSLILLEQRIKKKFFTGV